jgi:hypothetical protein
VTALSFLNGKIAPAERRALVRGFLLATLVYSTGYVVLWALKRTGLRSGWSDATVLVLLWLTFVGVTGRLAVVVKPSRVLTAALVSCASVLAAGLIRTALAAAGMRELLVWDHNNVIADAIFGELFFALVCLYPALFVAACARLIFRRSG